MVNLMPQKTAKKKIQAARKSKPMPKIRVWERSKDATDAILGNETEIEPSKKLRKIKFVDAIGLLNGCNEEMQKLDAAIGAKTKELNMLQEEGENQALMLDQVMQAYETASANNERIDAKLMAIEADIASKELEAEGAKSAADELRRAHAIAKEKLSQFMPSVAGTPDKSADSVAHLLALRTERLGQVSALKAQMEAFEKNASAEKKREDLLGEQVMELRDKLELNVEQIAGVHGALLFLNAKRKERQNDIAIILKKSGFGELSSLVSTLRAQIDEANETIVKTEVAARAHISSRDGMITGLKGNVKELRMLTSEQRTRFDALFAKAKNVISVRDSTIRTLERAIVDSGSSGAQIVTMSREIAALRQRLASAITEPPKAEIHGRVIGVMPTRDEELNELRRKMATITRTCEQAVTRHGKLRAAHERVVAMVDRQVLVLDSILSRPFGKGAAKKSLSKFRKAFKALESEMASNTD